MPINSTLFIVFRRLDEIENLRTSFYLFCSLSLNFITLCSQATSLIFFINTVEEYEEITKG